MSPRVFNTSFVLRDSLTKVRKVKPVCKDEVLCDVCNSMVASTVSKAGNLGNVCLTFVGLAGSNRTTLSLFPVENVC